jgi:hypothetical protein
LHAGVHNAVRGTHPLDLDFHAKDRRVRRDRETQPTQFAQVADDVVVEAVAGEAGRRPVICVEPYFIVPVEIIVG